MPAPFAPTMPSRSPHHPKGQPVDDLALPVALGDVAGLDHEAPRGFGIGGLHADAAHRAAHLAPVLAQLVQVAEAADVALAPGGDPVAQPVLLGGDLAVELVLVPLLLLEEGVAPRLEAGEALVDPARLAPVEPDRGPRQGREEAPVVANQHEGRAGALQLDLEPLDRRQVEVVGGLVEKQHVGLGGERLRQCGAPPLAAGELGWILGTREAEALQQVTGAVGRFARRQPGLDEIEGGVEAREVGFLGEVADRRAGLDETAPLVGIDESRGDLHERRLARPVPTDEAGALTRRDGDVGTGDQGRAAESQGDVLEGEERGSGHGPAYGSVGRPVQTAPPRPRRPVRRSDWPVPSAG